MRDFERASTSSRDEQAAAAGPGPGKRTLTEVLVAARTSAPVQRKVAAPAPERPRPTIYELFGSVQRKASGAELDTAAIDASAQRGIATAASPLPHTDRIQRSFGRHDISGIEAHTGSDAAAAAREIGARAYARGNHVVFEPGADLHTVAHEAAHVVQQRGGVQLAGGVGSAGDAYEQHADAVADLVVQGRSAEALLDERAGQAPTSSARGEPAVQRKVGLELELAIPVGNGEGWRGLARHLDAKTPITSGTGVQVVVDHSSRVNDTKFSIVELVTDAVPLSAPATTGLAQIDAIVATLHSIVARIPDPDKQQTQFGNLYVGLPAPVSPEDDAAYVDAAELSRSKAGSRVTSKKELRGGVTTDAFIQATIGVAPAAMRTAFSIRKGKRGVVTRYMDAGYKKRYAAQLPKMVDQIMDTLFKNPRQIAREVRREPIEALLLLVCSYLVGGKGIGKKELAKNIAPLLSKTDLAHVRDQTLNAAEKNFLADHKEVAGLAVSKAGRRDSQALIKGYDAVKCYQFAEKVLTTDATSDGFTSYATSTKKTRGGQTTRTPSPHLKKVDRDLAPNANANGAILELRSIPGVHAMDTWDTFFKNLYLEMLALHGFSTDVSPQAAPGDAAAAAEDAAASDAADGGDAVESDAAGDGVAGDGVAGDGVAGDGVPPLLGHDLGV